MTREEKIQIIRLLTNQNHMLCWIAEAQGINKNTIERWNRINEDAVTRFLSIVTDTPETR